jgi:coenzyme F420-0:L-glutamate ligase/coenzyme F420-1:gamma-L-glutamate ligase
MTLKMSVWPLPGMPEIVADDDIPRLIIEAVERSKDPLLDGDVLIITSKIISKAEGRTRSANERQAAIDEESVRVVASRRRSDGSKMEIVENRLGIVGAAAGVDASNTEQDQILLLPIDPDASARTIAQSIREETGLLVGVIISDTLGRPWREGQTDIAIGAAGVQVLEDYSGKVDSSGNELTVTRPCIADEMAAAGDLVKGKLSRQPVAVVRGLARHVGSLNLSGARSIVRRSDQDLFRLGTHEAYTAGFDEGIAAGLANADKRTADDSLL